MRTIVYKITQEKGVGGKWVWCLWRQGTHDKEGWWLEKIFGGPGLRLRP